MMLDHEISEIQMFRREPVAYLNLTKWDNFWSRPQVVLNVLLVKNFYI